MLIFFRQKPRHKPTKKEIITATLLAWILLTLVGIIISLAIEILRRGNGTNGIVELIIGTEELKKGLIQTLRLPIIRVNIFYIPAAAREMLYYTKDKFKEYVNNIIFIVGILSISYSIAYSILSITGYGAHIIGYHQTTLLGKIGESIYYAFSTSFMYGHPSIKPISRLGYITNIMHQGTIIYMILILIGHRTQVKSIGTSQPIENKKPRKRGKKQID